MVTSLNIFKPFHIDDTFHIEVAQHIIEHPFHPMSGEINWGGSTNPINDYNQPPLFFYLIAIVTYLFGPNEIALHFLVSVFSFLAIYYFDRILHFVKRKNTYFYLTLFALCPAFIINQNVMTDIPLLSLLLGSVYFFLSSSDNNRNLVLSFIFISAALLTKYSALPFLAAIIFTLLIRKDYQNLKFSLIPFGILAIWSGWNLIEYDHIHLLGRPRSGINLIRIPEFFCCLGAILFIAPFQKQIHKTSYYLVVISSILIGWLISQYDNSHTTVFLQTFFFLNGLILLTYFIVKGISKTNEINQFLVITTCSISGFIIFYAPFIATRHVLLIIPFILIFIHSHDSELSKLNRILTIGIALIISITLTHADYMYAHFYKQQATVFSKDEKAATYTIGHWGWQWYARQNGIKIYDKQKDTLQINDILIVPKDIAKQGISENIELNLIQTIVPKNNTSNPISVSNHASLYNSFIDRPVWTFSSQPLDTLCVYKVTKVID